MQTPWTGILRALGAEPEAATSVLGASGIKHEVFALGVDRLRKRLIVISPEPEPRLAAMASADIQAASGDVRVVTARPLFDDPLFFAPSAKRKRKTIGSSVQANATALFDLRRASGITTRQFFGSVVHSVEVASEATADGALSAPPIVLREHLSRAFVAADLAVGVCPLPMYQFEAAELDLFQRDGDPELISDSLRRHGVLQYFFPTVDHLALGLVDRGVLTRREVKELVASVPKEGHPLATAEIIAPETKLSQLLDALAERNLVVQGELSVELTPEGQAVRQVVRFQPREGLLSKVLNRFTVSLNLKDLFRP